MESSEFVNIVGAFKALSDPTRLRILTTVAKSPGQQCTITDLSLALDRSPVNSSLISFHVRELRIASLVQVARQGKYTVVKLNPAMINSLILFLDDTSGGEKGRHQASSEGSADTKPDAEEDWFLS